MLFLMDCKKYKIVELQFVDENGYFFVIREQLDKYSLDMYLEYYTTTDHFLVESIVV